MFKLYICLKRQISFFSLQSRLIAFSKKLSETMKKIGIITICDNHNFRHGSPIDFLHFAPPENLLRFE